MSRLLDSALTAQQRAECDANDQCVEGNLPIAAHAATELGITDHLFTARHIDTVGSIAKGMLQEQRAKWLVRCAMAFSFGVLTALGGVYATTARASTPITPVVDVEQWDRLSTQPMRRTTVFGIVTKTT